MVGGRINTQRSKWTWSLHAGKGSSDFDGIVSSAPSHGLRAKANCRITRREITRHPPIRTEAHRDVRLENTVRQRIQAVEVGRGGQLTVRDAEPNLGQFAFGQVAAYHRTALWTESRVSPSELPHGSQKCVARGAEHVAKYEIRPAGSDLRDYAAHVRIADGEATFADNLPPASTTTSRAIRFISQPQI